MIINVKAMQACVRYMRNSYSHISADDLKENGYSIKIKRFYKAVSSKFVRKGDMNEGNQKGNN